MPFSFFVLTSTELTSPTLQQIARANPSSTERSSRWHAARKARVLHNGIVLRQGAPTRFDLLPSLLRPIPGQYSESSAKLDLN